MLWCKQLALGTGPILTYIHLNGSNLNCEKRHRCCCWHPWQVYPFYSLDPSKQVCHAPKSELHFYETVQQLHLARTLNCNQECCQTLLKKFRREELVLRTIPCPCHLHNLTRHSYYKLMWMTQLFNILIPFSKNPNGLMRAKSTTLDNVKANILHTIIAYETCSMGRP